MEKMAVFWFLCSLFCISSKKMVNCLSTEAISLLTFKSSVSFHPSNLILSTWNPAKTHHCLWIGVTCDKVSGKVTSLNLSTSTNYNNASSSSSSDDDDQLITGKLTPALGNLTELRVLSIPYNAFCGEIPAELIGRLGHLEILELQGNKFSGKIPVQISTTLSNLRILNLSHNLLSGPIPKKLIGFSRIRAIDLSYNQLSDGIRIDHFSRCESLVHLKLSGNFLVNKIPPEIGNCSNLRSLLLDGNILQGKIPAEIGRISQLGVLDVSRNSLTDRIPKELANCWKLSVLVLTNLVDDHFDSPPPDPGPGGSDHNNNNNSAAYQLPTRGEFNDFMGGIPAGILLLPSLEIFWAPRANLRGRLMMNRWREKEEKDTCKLRILNLGQNYITGLIPQKLGMCKNLSFLDLSSNLFHGVVPSQLHVPCMVYFNISRNSLSGSLPRSFANSSCTTNYSLVSSRQDIINDVFDKENIENTYYTATLWMSKAFSSMLYDDEFVVLHDFSWNSFSSLLPLFSLGDGFLSTDRSKPSYRILLNNNKLNGSLPGILFSACLHLKSFAVDLSFNQLSGGIPQGLLFNCSQLTSFLAANNLIDGSIPPGIGDSQMLQYFDLRENRMNGLLPSPLGKLKDLKCILLSGNHFTGEIPAQLGHLSSLAVLDISRNALSGIIPSSLADAHNLEELLLHHNNLTGEIPPSFSTLANLTKLDVSFNNLSGHIPRLKHVTGCDGYKGNMLLQPCPDQNLPSPAGLPVPLEVHKKYSRKRKAKLLVIVMVVSASVIVLVLLTVILVLVFGRRKKLARVSSLKRQVVVTFTDVPAKLNYEIVVRATGNFSVRNLIGTGGFGATYKAELAPGFLVAVKRLSIGRFHGIQQFDAEIRTLGRIRHKNLVTLIGYYMGDSEMFLIYNYLSGGNLETFIHDRSGENVKWQVIHKIALDIAQAITYLHYSCAPRIVHRDIKPSNILLDEDLNAYLSDFGLAKLLEVSETHATTDVAGTFGYVAPEYATTCRVSDKSDVYSFGVVLLELMSGKKSLDPSFSEYGNGFNIVAWGRLLIMEGRASELFSPELWDTGPKENLLVMLRLASDCTVESLSVRLSMKQVLAKLKQLKVPEI